MKITAIIPARIGSKRIPRKNLEKVGGITLIEYAIWCAYGCDKIDEVVLLYDDDELLPSSDYGVVGKPNSGLRCVRRPPDTATDDAQIESAIEWYLETFGDKPDYIVLLQPTSPLRTSEDVDVAVEQIMNEASDSLVSVYKDRNLFWLPAFNPYRVEPNYIETCRPKSQDIAPRFIENGAIYIFKPWVLRERKARVGGRISFYIMPRIRSFEIDEPEDLELVRAIYDSEYWKQISR